MPSLKRFGDSTINLLQTAARAVCSVCHLRSPTALPRASNSSNAFSRAFCRTVKRPNRRPKSSGRKLCETNSPLHQSSNSDHELSPQQQQQQQVFIPWSNNYTNALDNEVESDSLSLESGVGFQSAEMVMWNGNVPMRIRSPGVESDQVSTESGAELELSGGCCSPIQQQPLPGQVEFEANLQDEDEESSQHDANKVMPVNGDEKSQSSTDGMDSNKSEASDMPPDFLSLLDDADPENPANRSKASSNINRLPSQNPSGADQSVSNVDETITASAVPSAVPVVATSVPQSGSNVDSLPNPANEAPASQSWMSSRLRRVQRGFAARLRRLRHAVSHRDSGQTSEAREVRNVIDCSENEKETECR